MPRISYYGYHLLSNHCFTSALLPPLDPPPTQIHPPTFLRPNKITSCAHFFNPPLKAPSPCSSAPTPFPSANHFVGLIFYLSGFSFPCSGLLQLLRSDPDHLCQSLFFAGALHHVEVRVLGNISIFWVLSQSPKIEITCWHSELNWLIRLFSREACFSSSKQTWT